MTNYIKITSDLFNDVVKNMNTHYNSYTYLHNGKTPEYQQEMEDILTDIRIASENGEGYICVEEGVVKALHEQGIFEGVQ